MRVVGAGPIPHRLLGCDPAVGSTGLGVEADAVAVGVGTGT